MGNTCESKPSKPSVHSKPQIIYWCVHGRSDFCQAMLCAGGILFELDEKTANDWPAAKNDTPFGQIPVLKHGDVVIAQGGAMTRYCARLAGLYPSDEVEASICDMYIDEMMDIFQGLFKVSSKSAGKEANVSCDLNILHQTHEKSVLFTHSF